ncbi:hypothetical protein A6J39_003735 [Legionella anisa]|uniref:Uncharacterized protein n=1 Tax=Legionella anisa TaxID=28082 RepID=A0AAX0WR47_9GAMM|nr:hypothetical protein A6J39_003735 [Legionella anisa]
MRYLSVVNIALKSIFNSNGEHVSALRDIILFYLVCPNIEIQHAVRSKSSHQLPLNSNRLAPLLF